MSSRGFHFQMSEANSRPVLTSSTTHWLNTEVTLRVLKSVIEYTTFQKTSPTLTEMHPKFSFVD
jgi:hypothetical protein